MPTATDLRRATRATSRLLLTGAIALLWSPAWSALRAPEPQAVAAPAVSATEAFGFLEVLAGQIGERPAGTPAEDRAVEYIAAQLKSFGLDVTVQAIPVPVWHERRARFWVRSGDTLLDFPAKAIVFSGVTAATGLTADFVDIGTASDFDLKGKNLQGKIVLVKRDVYIDYPDYWLTDKLKPLGVAGMVFYSAPGRRGIPTAYYNFKRALKEPTPPAVDISYEDAARLVRMRAAKVSITVEADVDWKESHSVIGELKGATKPDEVVMFSAHDDTAYTSPGAFDDGGGVAAVLELAHAFAAGPRPARTMRFVAWGGHELGLMGSEKYLRTYTGDLSKIIALINYDGVGAALGSLDWSASGDPKWVKFLHDTQLALGMDDVGSVSPSGTDATNFSSLEIPSLQIGQQHGSNSSHTPYDDLASLAPAGMEAGLALAAALGAKLAGDPSLNFSHHFPPAVLKDERDYAARWGWGIRPESNPQ